MKVKFYDSIYVFLGFGDIGLQVPDLQLVCNHKTKFLSGITVSLKISNPDLLKCVRSAPTLPPLVFFKEFLEFMFYCKNVIGTAE